LSKQGGNAVRKKKEHHVTVASNELINIIEIKN